MRVLGLVPSRYGTSPGQRFRMEQWAPWLQREGIEIQFEPFESEELHAILYKRGYAARKLQLVVQAWMRRVRLLRTLPDYHAVYVFREAALLGPPVFERRIHRASIPLVFDFDDAIFQPYISPANRYLSLLKFPQKTRRVCAWASHVMAGNEYLASYARAVNERVTVVPSTIDTDLYNPAIRRGFSNTPPVIGWSGSHSTVQHLDTLKPALTRLARTERFRLRVIGTGVYRLPDVAVDSIEWRAATEVEDLAPIDIGVMPLPDDPWTRGKCGMKALQYMALGIPTICSPVGVNTTIIQEGENGLLASTEDEWVAKLTYLLRSHAERQRLGGAGRATVEAGYAAAVQAPRVAAVLKSCCST